MDWPEAIYKSIDSLALAAVFAVVFYAFFKD